ncbi:MAG TPA: class I SAM-dependent methyltransferase [Phycisphaerales bacterium]|jgi:SAM-dependent methyltransferase|nr:class I SAM-dependent methyltransferase [Phycisphaerales bacterium]HIB00443.1 class I SAM-dependent methyltransferase [Phycisphaerales bacterium]HIB50070.1 class I SAM-dependent methyltransferase [Phycisphaerales bacterium]HIN84802.1 class I SAM-dependent methyltransferase [Phycisphaerales bacterium]HIO52632.1 class I SAM-dependent methyltransferase [Phycisphaerales bacterium]
MNNWLPMDSEQSALQTKTILELLGNEPLDIIDVGCGDGRLLIPMAVAGHTVIGIDCDPGAISSAAAHCAETNVDAELIDGSLFDVLPLSQPVDAIVCCGQTFMLLHDVDEAVKALKLFKQSLRPNGLVILDDIPGDLWLEVAEGNWANGVNSESTLQLVWAKNDAVFAIREGDLVDAEGWELTEKDTPLRLWTMGALRLAAQLAELSAPVVPVTGAILVMRAVE